MPSATPGPVDRSATPGRPRPELLDFRPYGLKAIPVDIDQGEPRSFLGETQGRRPGDALRDRIERFIAYFNQTMAKPFK